MRENVRNLNVSGINGNLALRVVLFEDFFSLILISSRCSCLGDGLKFGLGRYEVVAFFAHQST